MESSSIPQAPVEALPGALRSQLLLHAPLLLLVGVYLVLTSVLLPDSSPAAKFPPLLVAAIGLLWVGFGMPVALVYLIRGGARWLARVRGKQVNITSSPWLALVERVAAASVALLVIVPFMQAVTRWKTAIPALQPFSWDERLMQWDRVIHFGHHPWELAQRLVYSPEVTVAIDRIYGWGWFALFAFVLAWQAWSGRRVLRQQFLLAWVVMWTLLGNLFAVLFSSAGPVYYDRVTGDLGPYAGLFRYLDSVHAQTALDLVAVRDLLWRSYEAGAGEIGTGISAMPSLHVATAVLFACLGWRIHWMVGTGFSLFALCTLFGSVHLGWHYAVDGYFSLLLVPGIWWICGWGARSWDQRIRRQPKARRAEPERRESLSTTEFSAWNPHWH